MRQLLFFSFASLAAACAPAVSTDAGPSDAGPTDGGYDAGCAGSADAGAAACDLRRGHFDCANDFECVDDGNCDDTGRCESAPNNSDKTGTGGLCAGAGECFGGICDRGVCARPCDYECFPDGYTCDEAAIPSGLCRADDCVGDDNNCPPGFSCLVSSTGDTVCAVPPFDAGP